jgi:hypothetical protein
VVEQVITAGIKAILNFSPGALKVPADVKLKSVDLTCRSRASRSISPRETRWRVRRRRSRTLTPAARRGMVDRRRKAVTAREARARGEILMSPQRCV